MDKFPTCAKWFVIFRNGQKAAKNDTCLLCFWMVVCWLGTLLVICHVICFTLPGILLCIVSDEFHTSLRNDFAHHRQVWLVLKSVSLSKALSIWVLLICYQILEVPSKGFVIVDKASYLCDFNRNHSKVFRNHQKWHSISCLDVWMLARSVHVLLFMSMWFMLWKGLALYCFRWATLILCLWYRYDYCI